MTIICPPHICFMGVNYDTDINIKSLHLTGEGDLHLRKSGYQPCFTGQPCYLVDKTITPTFCPKHEQYDPEARERISRRLR